MLHTFYVCATKGQAVTTPPPQFPHTKLRRPCIRKRHYLASILNQVSPLVIGAVGCYSAIITLPLFCVRFFLICNFKDFKSMYKQPCSMQEQRILFRDECLFKLLWPIMLSFALQFQPYKIK